MWISCHWTTDKMEWYSKIWKSPDNSSLFFYFLYSFTANIQMRFRPKRKKYRQYRDRRQKGRASTREFKLSYYCMIVMLNKFVRVLNTKIPICEPFNILVYTSDRDDRTQSNIWTVLMNYLFIWIFIFIFNRIKIKICAINSCLFIYLHMKCVCVWVKIFWFELEGAVCWWSNRENSSDWTIGLVSLIGKKTVSITTWAQFFFVECIERFFGIYLVWKESPNIVIAKVWKIHEKHDCTSRGFKPSSPSSFHHWQSLQSSSFQSLNIIKIIANRT